MNRPVETIATCQYSGLQFMSNWDSLVDYVVALHYSDPYKIALTAMMRRLRRDLKLDRSLTHDPSCKHCIGQITAQFAGSERELMGLFMANLEDIQHSLSRMPLQRDWQMSAIA
ncbi:MAG: hypothetical protein GYB68_04850 [Chloroflexi bacterium]|nr:hypothetical protein [Chloroflexota bacterium]